MQPWFAMRRHTILVLGAVAALAIGLGAGAGSAYGYFTSIGTGSGSANTGTAQQVTLVATTSGSAAIKSDPRAGRPTCGRS